MKEPSPNFTLDRLPDPKTIAAVPHDSSHPHRRQLRTDQTDEVSAVTQTLPTTAPEDEGAILTDTDLDSLRARTRALCAQFPTSTGARPISTAATRRSSSTP